MFATASPRWGPSLLLLVGMLSVTACQSAGPGDPLGADDDPSGRQPQLVSTDITIRDLSETPPGLGALVEGTITLSGVTVELWNGDEWITVTQTEATEATLAVGDGNVEATLLPPTDVPAGEYTRIRLTAAAATVELEVTLNGNTYTATLGQDRGTPLVLEKDVEVVDNEDGSRTLRVALETIRTIQILGADETGLEITVGGDLGSESIGFEGGASTSVMMASAVLVDTSDPELPEHVGLEGNLTLTGLTTELWDGEAWLTVTDGTTTEAVLTIGDGSVEATLFDSEIPAGDYTKARLTASEASVQLTFSRNDLQTEFELQSTIEGPIVVETDVEVVENEDGSRTLIVALATLRTVEISEDPAAGEVSLTIAGDFGAMSMSAGARGG